MGFECNVREVFEFLYHAKLDCGLSEHEYDHVLIGRFDGSPKPNADEVDDWKWVDLTSLESDVKENPNNYTYWLRVSLGELCRSIRPAEGEWGNEGR